MAELIVIGYDTPEKAEAARSELFGLSKEYLVEVGDAVVAMREPNGKIKLNQMVNLSGRPAGRSGACSQASCSSTHCSAW